MKTLIIILILILLSVPIIAEDTLKPEIKIDGTIHPFNEVYKLIERSDIVYLLDLLDTTSKIEVIEERVLPDLLYVKELKGNKSLHYYPVSDSVAMLTIISKSASQAGDYKSSILALREVLKIEPSFSNIYTLIGNEFFKKKILDSAIHYYNISLDSNFYNYQAHWFLAESLWEIGDSAGCIDHMTTAHLLNFHHKKIFSRLKTYRSLSGNEWKEWSFNPIYSLSKEENVVRIQFDTVHFEFMPYVVVKALWKYEPEYAEKMLGFNVSGNQLNDLEEKEALLAYLTFLSTLEDTTAITYEAIFSEYLDEFIYYEIALKRFPEFLYLLPKKIFDRTKEYLNKYH